MNTIGGVSIEDSIKNAEIRIGALERMVAKLIQLAPAGAISEAELVQMRRDAARELSERFPDEVISENQYMG